MRRTMFLTSAAALAAAWLCELPAVAGALVPGTRLSQERIFAALPLPVPGTWVRYVMGFGVPYLKQIGFGVERTPVSQRYYIESETGVAGGACNPNTVKKAYLRGDRFGSIVAREPVQAYVARAGSMVMLYEGPDAPAHVLLLDDRHLYTGDPCTLRASAPATVRAAGRSYACTHASIAVDGETAPVGSLRSFEVWTSDAVALGVVKMRAILTGSGPFELTLDSFGTHFVTGIPESLDAIRATQAG